jgi:hypothetical protein
MAYDVTVGPDQDIVLKANQVVHVVRRSGATVVILVHLPNGASGIYQVDTTAVEPIPAPSAGVIQPKTNAVSTPVAPSPSEPSSPADSEPSDSTYSPFGTLHPETNPSPSHPTTPPSRPVTPAPTQSSYPVIPKTPVVPPAPKIGDPNLPENSITQVHVSLAQDTKLPAPYQDLDIAKAGSYSYRVYLPPGYYEHPHFRYPALFIMSPSGNASLGNFKARATNEGWIVVMFVDAKNGPWGRNYGNFLSTMADVTPKLRIQEGLKFATGFSGGARGTSMLTQICPGFNGELCQGAGFSAERGEYFVQGIPRDHPYAVFMAMGLKDSNFIETTTLKDALAVPFKLQTFPGGHMEAPTPVVDQGLDWLIEQALAGDTAPTGDLGDTATRQFIFLTKRVEALPDGPDHNEQAKALIAIGENLNFRKGSPEALELKKIKDALPLEP